MPVFLLCLLLIISPCTQASFLSEQLCFAYRTLFDQSFVAIISALAFAGLLWGLAIDEGEKHFKTKLLKVGIGVLGLVNIDQIVALFTGRSVLC